MLEYRSNLPMPIGIPPGLVLPRVPWSFTVLDRFEGCPLSYAEQNVRKHYPFVSSPAMEMGLKIHKMLEDYVQKGTTLPIGLQHIGNLIDKLTHGARQTIGEQSVQFTHMLQPCETFDDDVSYRGKIDLCVIRPDNVAFVLDYKTGMPRESMEQLEWMAVAALLLYPKCEKVHAAFIYTKGSPAKRCTVVRDDIPALVAAIYPRLERLRLARESNSYQPTPGRACKWCPVVTCAYHPKRG